MVILIAKKELSMKTLLLNGSRKALVVVGALGFLGYNQALYSGDEPRFAAGG